VRHRSSKDLRVHLRNLESIFLPSRIDCVDGVLQVTVPRAVPALQYLPRSIYHCLSANRTRSGTSTLADHLLPIEDLHDAGELLAPWHGDTHDPILRGPSDTQLKQQTTKLWGNNQCLLTVGAELCSCSNGLYL
jgi:hypothetical protein